MLLHKKLNRITQPTNGFVMRFVCYRYQIDLNTCVDFEVLTSMDM